MRMLGKSLTLFVQFFWWLYKGLTQVIHGFEIIQLSGFFAKSVGVAAISSGVILPAVGYLLLWYWLNRL